MRYMMVSLSVLVMLSSQDLFASAKTDSIVAFLGGKNAKTVWVKWAWCNDDYTPKTAAAALAAKSSVEFLDTRTGTQRTLATVQNNPCIVRISKSGKWVTWANIVENKSYICALDNSSTSKPLMDKAANTYWMPAAWWMDTTTQDEYLFCIDNCEFPASNNAGGTGIVKVKINSDGTVNHASKETLNIKGLTATTADSKSVEIMMSVSKDGKKLGGAFPWPDTKILDIPSGTLLSRHASADLFGCQVNIAPDNSYRFYHCDGDHTGGYLFTGDLTNPNAYTAINMLVNLAGFTTKPPSIEEPRWTNDVQYYTATTGSSYDLGGMAWEWFDYGTTGEFDGSVWGYSSTKVKSLGMDVVSRFYLAKWSADFKAQEKTMMIASDNRYAQGRGELWIEQTPTSTSPVKVAANQLSGLSVVQNGTYLRVQADGAVVVSITNSQGRLVRRVTGSGSIAVDTRDMAIGAYVISAQQHSDRLTKQMTVTR